MIDLNRPGGLVIKVGTIAGSRAEVCMYKSSPGDYLSLKGGPLSVEDAAAAGFDTAAHLREKSRLAARAEGLAAVDAAIPILCPGTVVTDAAGVRVVYVSDGWYVVEGADGAVSRKLNRVAAEEFAEALRS